MTRRIASLFLLAALGCASRSWTPPQVDRIDAGDTRICTSARSCTDLVVAVDTSVSSVEIPGAEFSWLDVFRDPPDAGPGSKLWNGLDGLTRSLGTFDATSIGVGLIGFAGWSDSPDAAAWVEAEVTNDFAAIEKAARQIRARGAGGASCHACAVELAGTLLTRPTAEKRCTVLVILADTEVTLPLGPGYAEVNERRLALAIRESGVTRSVLVDLGAADTVESERLKSLLSEVYSPLIPAPTAADVATAIASTAASCKP